MKEKKTNPSPKLFNIPVGTLLVGLTLFIIAGSIGYLIGSQGTSTVIIDKVKPTISLVPSKDSLISPSVSGCAPAGCSGELCVEATEAGNIASTCEIKAEYSCLKYSTCERQATGKCGWTNTPQYIQCISNTKVQNNNSGIIPQ